MSITKKDFGINLKTVHCPKCETEQPKIRMPKGWKEILWGGHTCNNCGCRMDKYGTERKKVEVQKTEHIKQATTMLEPQKTLPKFVVKRQTPSGTYEVYRGNNAESARNFLALKKVEQNKYYIKVETPEGNWGVDIDGLYLEQLVPFQSNINSAQCQGFICSMPSPSSLKYAFNKMVDNFVVIIKCGNCNHEWSDGIRYKNLTVVRCPKCNNLNKVDSSPHITEMDGLLGFKVEI